MRKLTNRRSVLGWSAAAAAVAVAAGGVNGSRADAAVVTVYSNLNTQSGNFYQPAGTTAAINGGQYTSLVADDITPIDGYAGQTVTSTTFSVFNPAAHAVTFSAELRFYDTDGPGFTPGTLLFAEDTSPLTVGADQSILATLALPTSGASTFALPGDTFWAGLAFTDDGGLTGASALDLSNLGQLLADPATVGVDQDVYYQSDAAGPFNANDPSGQLLDYGGTPVASMAWAFTVGTTAVPEPATAGLALAAAAAAGLGRRRRQRA